MHNYYNIATTKVNNVNNQTFFLKWYVLTVTPAEIVVALKVHLVLHKVPHF